MSGDETLSQEEHMAKRLGILNAILIPDADIRQHVLKPPKPVNSFRFIFKEYFGAPIELLPERTFYWENEKASGAAVEGTHMVEVTHD
jgi:hypothetical protein